MLVGTVFAVAEGDDTRTQDTMYSGYNGNWEKNNIQKKRELKKKHKLKNDLEKRGRG